MREFQIWHQNSNRITFTPPFGQKTVETGKISDLANFRRFFDQQVVQMLFDLNFETRFGILSSFSMS